MKTKTKLAWNTAAFYSAQVSGRSFL